MIRSLGRASLRVNSGAEVVDNIFMVSFGKWKYCKSMDGLSYLLHHLVEGLHYYLLQKRDAAVLVFRLDKIVAMMGWPHDGVPYILFFFLQ